MIAKSLIMLPLAICLTTAAQAQDDEVTVRNVRILAVSPTPPGSGIGMNWLVFGGVADGRPVMFFEIYFGDRPPPQRDDICDISYQISGLAGNLGTIRDAWIVRSRKCTRPN
jgi:hypothetical protein